MADSTSLTVYVDARSVKAYTGVGVVVQSGVRGPSRDFFLLGPAASTPHRAELIAIFNALHIVLAVAIEHPDANIDVRTDSDACLRWLNGSEPPRSLKDNGLVKMILKYAQRFRGLVTFSKIASGHNPAHDVARSDFKRWPTLLRYK